MSKYKTLNKKPTCFVISSPSGAGKTTLVSKALEILDNVERTISHTTRMPRPGEKDARDYYFINKPEFQARIQADEFAEYALVYDNLYGTSKKTIEGILNQGKDAILVIENQGAKEVVKCFDPVVLILVVPPSIEVLRDRLSSREGSQTDDLQDRLNKAEREIKDMNWYHYTIINDNIDTAVARLVEIISDSQRGAS